MTQSQSPTTPRCKRCAFFGTDLYDGSPVCRRKPPVAPANSPDHPAHFPATLSNGWCGEFVPGHEGVIA